MKERKIEWALLSVTDKAGIVELAEALRELGIGIISTGGTAKVLEEAGIEVVSIDQWTGFPEIMGGRVKTLHPLVHGGILANRNVPEHLTQAKEHGIKMIGLVVVNLYAFKATVAKEGVTYEEAIENIDIGGPSMLRSAAKNHASVAVVTDPNSYDAILEEMRANDGATILETRKRLALEVFKKTSAYDNAIYEYLAGEIEDYEGFPKEQRFFLTDGQPLRYGENPDQAAVLYHFDNGDEDSNALCQLANASLLQGKEMSHNNWLDTDAAWTAVRDFIDPACVIVKHLTPCGIASDMEDLVVAYQKAYACDTISAFGGVMAFNQPVTTAVVEAIFTNGQFVEAIVAPSFETEALTLLTEKPNTRVLSTGGINPPGSTYDFRSIEGGVLLQEADIIDEDVSDFEVVSERQPTDDELVELFFAWTAAKAAKSNAIVIAKDSATVGIGSGQTNRVESSKLAVKQAGKKAKGAVAASDAFFPFADGFETLAEAGVTAVIEPGGSVRDDEVIAAANAAGVALVFTDHRHFRH